ncbi:MAG: serine/threonine protein kinase [Faecousia sp.]
MSETKKTVFGDLRIEKTMKSGGHNGVYLAWEVQTGRRCVYREFDGTGEVYRKLQQIQSAHLPRVYDVKEENGRVYALEEYIQGDSLALLLESGPLPETTAGEILCQLCDALELLHKAGVVHRDIKPENILMRGSEAVLIDFDVSRMVKPEHDTDTRIMGTTGYAAPEQFGFSQTDARADIYAMGILFNELLTRQHPSKHLAEGRFRPVIERCIEVNVDKRYTTAAQLRQAIEFCGRQKPRDPLPAVLAGAAVMLALVLAVVGIRSVFRSPQTPENTPSASETAAMEVFQRQAVEIPQEPWPESSLGFTTAFSYDLNGDGIMENYQFGTYQECVPAGARHTLEDHFSLVEGDMSQRVVYPCVWRCEADGSWQLMTEFAGLLTDTQTQLWRVVGTETPAPMTYTAQSTWRGGIQAQFTTENQGAWLFLASATLNGQEMTAATVSYVSPMAGSRDAESHQALEVAQEPWPGLAVGYMTPFTYDLDGDGEPEEYEFGTYQESIPDGYRHTLSDHFSLDLGFTGDRVVYPCVWRREADGTLQLMTEFAELLTDPQTQVWRSEDTESPAPVVYAAEDQWRGGVHVVYSYQNAGSWLYAVSATLDGQELTAATVSHLSTMASS